MRRFCALVSLFLLTFLAAQLVGCSRSPQSAEVIVYTSQDQEYAEPILAEFTRQTGIKVRPVFDSEAVKTVGLVNRLLAERGRPQCDVFWNNEELRSRQLEAREVFRVSQPWQATGYRSRCLVINTNRLTLAAAPRSFRELTNATWRGQVALAYPLFGTTATHFLALRQHWGPDGWLAWCRALIANQPLLVDGNSVVVKLVARGEAVVGMTDSDDILAAQREGLPVAAAPLAEDSLLIPNTVAVIRNAPHPEAAQQLAGFLLSRATAEKLVAANALEGVAASAVATPTLRPDWAQLVRDLEAGTAQLKELFLR